VLPAFSTPAIAESDTEIYIEIIGRLPFLFPFTGVLGTIVNVGDSPVYNISYTFSITGGYNDDINATYSDNWSELPSETGLGFFNGAYGFGLVLITLTASASNANNVTKSTKGFQIGKRTLVSFSLLRYLIFVLVFYKSIGNAYKLNFT